MKGSFTSPYWIFFSLAIICVTALYALIHSLTAWNGYVVWLVSLGVTTFVLFGFDKLQSKRNGLRVPEIVLHALTLLGGFIGTWLGMLVFHHKSNAKRHPSFLIIPIVSLLLHAGLVYWRVVIAA